MCAFRIPEKGERREGQRGDMQGLGDVFFFLLLSLEQEVNAVSSSASPGFPRPPLPPSTFVLSMKGDLKERLGGCGWFGEREEVKPTAQIRDPRLVEACRRAAFPFFAAFRLQ